MELYWIAPNLLAKKILMKSFMRRQVTNEYTRTVKNSIGVTEATPGIPKIEINDTIIILTTMDRIKGLLGLDSQKCFLSLTVNTVK